MSENGSLVFSTGDGNAIGITDTAAGPDSLTLSVTHGTLTLAGISGLTFTSGNNGTSSFTVTGATSDLDNALNGLTYQPNPGYVGSDALLISVIDTADTLSASTSVGLTVVALSPPAITAPTSGSLFEDGSLVFSTGNSNAVSVTDSGAGSGADSLTLALTHGTLTLASTAGLTFSTGSNGSATFTVSGTVSSLNNALNGLKYQPIPAYIGSDSLAISIADPGDNDSASTSVSLTVNVQPPVLTAPSTGSLSENGSLVFSSGNGNPISFTDVNAGTAKTESLTLSVSHGILTLGSTTGLTYTTGKNSSATIAVTGTLTNLNAALAGLTYKPTAGYWGSDSLSITVADGVNKQSASASVALTITALSPPTITAPSSVTTGEDLAIVFSSTNGNAISVADANSTSGTLSLSVTNGILTLGSTPGLTFKAGRNGSSSFTIAATLANLNKALTGLTYTPSTGYSGFDTLAISLLDTTDGQSATGNVGIAVAPATAPTITAPSTGSLNENSTLVFSAANSNAISFTDANAGTIKTESLTLSVTNGTLKLGSTTGLTFTAGKNSSASFTVTGTVTNLDNALNGLTYKPNTNYSGADTLAISVSDPPDGLSATTSVALSVATLSPTLTAPSTATVAENGSVQFTKANNDLISVTDVNAGTGIEQVTLSATNGKLKLGSTTGLTFTSGANSSSAMTITGTLANLNNALKNLTFTPLTGYVGSASIAIGYTDLGSSLTASGAIQVTVGSSGPTSRSSQPQTAGTLTSPPNSTSDDTQNQWAGFSAAVEVLNG